MNGNGNNENNYLKFYNVKHFKRKRDQVQAIADNMSPEIITISEANLFKGTPEEQSVILGYKIIKPLTHDNSELNYSKILLFIRENINFDILTKNMDKSTS